MSTGKEDPPCAGVPAATMPVILRLATGREGWQVRPTDYGSAGDSYLASCSDLRLVLKFAALPPGLERLSQLGVAPRLIGHGEHEGRPWLLQEYVPGYHPPPSWFADHLPMLAAGLRRYHDDPQLHSLLLQDAIPRHRDTPVPAREDVAHVKEALNLVWPTVPGAANAFDRYEAQVGALELHPWSPVHPDPNRQNVIVAGDRFFLIDWLGIRLSDPLSDAGVMLWWYVPAARWPQFFVVYGMDLDQAALDRLYGWAAWRSLQVARWLTDHGRRDDAREFLIDFVAAACHRPNPHWSP